MSSDVVLITGAGSGLGLQASVLLAQRGLRVFASVRDLSRADALRAAAEAAGFAVEIIELDVTSPASIAAAVDRVLTEAGRIDVLVNNAAVCTIGPLEFSTDEEIESTFATNVVGPIRLIRAVLPAMRRQGRGRIVNVSSGSAQTRTGVRLLSLYAASKAALHTLTLDLNKELVPLGIRAVLVEGGVGGASKINDAIAARAAGFGSDDSPYAVAERVAAAQIGVMTRTLDDGSPAARMIADACTAPDPALRFPPEAQRPLDWAQRLNDQDFLKLCRLDDVERVVARSGLTQSAWRIR
ncbi:MAG TPA: SDR family NAD(P)-dependent oxidoreductase [Thermoanaerobaculia bacterium]